MDKKKINTIEQAWLEYKSRLLSFIRSRVATKEDAEDILNEVFEKLVKQTKEKGSPQKVSNWLYRITRNLIVDYYRSKKTFEQLPDNLPEEISDTDVMNQLSNCMLPMIQALPETYQRVMILSEIEGKNQKQVADELGLTLSAVKSRILRGRQKLYKSMTSCCEIYRNKAGEIIDYEQKSFGFCDD